MATRWASAAGSNVLTGLNIDSVTWQSGVITRYLFSASPDFSGVVPGFFLETTGCTNALNTGRFLISAVNNTTKTIDVINTAVTDATSDETSSPGTGIVKQNTSVFQEPTTAKQAAGWLDGERPPAGWLNWLFKNSGRSQVAIASVGLSRVASATYTDLDGAGVSFASAIDTASNNYTPSADDGTYETLTGTSETLATQANRILSFCTQTIDAQTTVNAGNIRYRVNSTDVFTLEMGLASSALVVDSAFSLFGISGSLSAGSNTAQFQVNRKTDRTFSDIRAGAFELKTVDADGNALVIDSAIPTTAQTIPDTNTYTDATGFTSTGTFNNGYALVVAQFIAETSGIANGGFKLLRGATSIAEFPFTGQLLHRGPGSLQTIFRLVPFTTTGSQTVKLQAKASGNTIDLCASNSDGTWAVIELADQFGTTNLMRFKTELNTNTAATSATPLATSGAQVTSGHNVIMFLSGQLTFSAAGQSIYFQFKRDGVAVGDLYQVKGSDSTAGDKIVGLVAAVSAETGSHTYSVDWHTSTGTATAVDLQFAAFEMDKKDPLGGDACSVTITDVTQSQPEISFSTAYVCSTDDALQFRLMESVNGDPAAEAHEWPALTAPGTADTPITLSWIRPTQLADGDDVTYTIQAKKATGQVLVAGSQLSAKEVLTV